MDLKTISDLLKGTGPNFGQAGLPKRQQDITNETGWMTEPTFQERWKGQNLDDQPDLSTSEKLQEFLNPKPQEMNIQWLLRNKNKAPTGWIPNQFPKSSPTMDEVPNNNRYPPAHPMEGYNNPAFPRPPNSTMTVPYDPYRPEVYNYPIGNQ